MIRVYKRYYLDADSRQVILTKKVKKEQNIGIKHWDIFQTSQTRYIVCIN